MAAISCFVRRAFGHDFGFQALQFGCILCCTSRPPRDRTNIDFRLIVRGAAGNARIRREIFLFLEQAARIGREFRRDDHFAENFADRFRAPGDRAADCK